jgi:hypothetical protein
LTDFRHFSHIESEISAPVEIHHSINEYNSPECAGLNIEINIDIDIDVNADPYLSIDLYKCICAGKDGTVDAQSKCGDKQTNK